MVTLSGRVDASEPSRRTRMSFHGPITSNRDASVGMLSEPTDIPEPVTIAIGICGQNRLPSARPILATRRSAAHDTHV